MLVFIQILCGFWIIVDSLQLGDMA